MNASSESALSARAYSVEALFALGRFDPASVQRDFRWEWDEAEKLLTAIRIAAEAAEYAPDVDEENVDALEADAADADEEDAPDALDSGPIELQGDDADQGPPTGLLFAGTMILRGDASGGYEIFDGLQRLTTLTIFAAALRDTLGDAALARRLGRCVQEEAGGFRLRHPGKGATALKTFVQPGGAARVVRRFRLAPDQDAERRVFEIQRETAKLVLRIGEEQRRTLAEFLLSSVRVVVVFIEEPAAARQAFVSINHYGVPLRRDEIFKGELLSLAGSEEEQSRFEGVWNSVRAKIGDDLEDFLGAVDVITRRKPQSEDYLGDLYRDLETRAASGRLSRWVALLPNYASAWETLQAFLDRKTDDPLEIDVWRLNIFEWRESKEKRAPRDGREKVDGREWTPLALHWIERYRAQTQTAEGRRKHLAKYRRWFQQLARRCVAMTLYEYDGLKRARKFRQALSGAMRARPCAPFSRGGAGSRPFDFSAKIRGDIRARLSLPIENRDARRIVMRWREASLWGAAPPPYVRWGTVEHVLPAKPELASQWRSDFPDEERRYRAHHLLGNMCLVDFDANQRLGNLDFKAKMKLLATEQQLERYKTAEGIRDAGAWTEAAIEARTGRAAEEIWASLELADP